MRKSTLLKLLFTVMLGIASIFGVLTVTAQPAHALYCWNSFADCWFVEARSYEYAICCIYQCPDGSEVTGMCEPI
jgi:hypothetical protein